MSEPVRMHRLSYSYFLVPASPRKCPWDLKLVVMVAKQWNCSLYL